MDIVRVLPLELARVVYGFGYPGQTELHQKLMREMKSNLFKGSSRGASVYEIVKYPLSEVRSIKKWADFCRCCERHRQNRHNNNPAKSKPPYEDCLCYCRRKSRSCLMILELSPAERNRLRAINDSDSDDGF